MAENFYTLITQIGLAKIANAQLTSSKLNLKTIAVGDGGGSYYNPTSDATGLKREVWRGEIGAISIDEVNANWIVVDTVITATVGGFTVREVGLLDDEGDLIALGKHPESYKPVLADGSSKDLFIRVIIEVANTSTVTLKVDPTVIIASRKYVDEKFDGAKAYTDSEIKKIPQPDVSGLATKQEVAVVEQTVTTHMAEDATLTTKGHVQLSDDANSENTSYATTPNAVRKTVEQNSYAASKSGKDSNGIFTTVQHTRKSDGKLVRQSVLSGGASPQYTTRTITYYKRDGTTIEKTETFTLSYDADGDLISEV